MTNFMAQFPNPEPEWRGSTRIPAAIDAGVVARQAIEILTRQQRERTFASAQALGHLWKPGKYWLREHC